jgi:uncharacterized protein YbcI
MPDQAPRTQQAADVLGLTLAEISRSIVAIQKRNYGKGPVRARAHLGKNVLTVILEGGYTTIEHTLEEHGHTKEVIDSRLALQKAVETEMRAAVETTLHRSVRSFMSANDPANDLQAEIFVLHPAESAVEQDAALVLAGDGDGTT